VKKSLLAIVGGFLALNVAIVVAAYVARRRLPTYGDERSDTFALVAAMDGVSFTSKADPFRAGSATAVAGGIEIDLTGAVPAGVATLDLTAIAGGIDVEVPPDWRVEMRSTVVLGGTDDGTDPDAADEDAPVLVVDARAYLGGISVRVKRPVDQEMRPGAE
jgi:hypothetical protein